MIKHAASIFKICLLYSPFLFTSKSFSQSDTVKSSLEQVIIKAYENNRKQQDVPASVNYFNRENLSAFGTNNILAAVRTLPGARIEERSPGSYRVNIRGSSLRSPFGVRNVKVYLNNIPITDPGGNTYLNQLGSYNFGSLTIIKGPGSSLYGSGTGGVLLIEGMDATEQAGFVAEYTLGSYGAQNVYAGLTSRSENYSGKVSFQHQESDGYRSHSEMKRDILTWNGNFQLPGQQSLSATVMLSKLFYQTPGALTRNEYVLKPRGARPGNAAFPGAEAANASITQKQFMVGVTHTIQINKVLKSETTLYGMFTELRNPAIQNYGHNSEPHAGGRTTLKTEFQTGDLNLNLQVGTEWQRGLATVSIHNNKAGIPDSLRTLDEINNVQGLVFAQAVADYKQWTLTAGLSVNELSTRFQRFSPLTAGEQRKSFSNQYAPRVALMRKLGSINVYASLAKGFSPPTTSELLPTGGAVNFDLNPESGTNYDFGIKGIVAKNLYVDINAFKFGLSNTIVQRRNAGGGDYYINAGSTRQQGVETALRYGLWKNSTMVETSDVWLSHTWHNFKYTSFRQLENDFSGKRMPGEPVHAVSAGYNMVFRNGVNAMINYYYSSSIYLNDANTEVDNSYALTGLRLGYRLHFNKGNELSISSGVDNLFDVDYSFGNDINGFNGRYFNAAAGRNYYVTIRFNVPSGNKKD